MVRFYLILIVLFRRDRDNIVSNKKDGGGVLTAVSKRIFSKRRFDLETDIEIIWIECKLHNNHKLFLATVYLPPDSTLSTLSLFEQSLDNVYRVADSSDSIIILGDFNSLSRLRFHK